MTQIGDLFDKRSIVGAKIEKIISECEYTKKDLCEKAGISRPTLDKLLTGTLTSKTNYEKHISKVMDYLGVTPDVLLGNVKNEYNRTRELKSLMKITSEQIAKATDISVARLEAIEAGEQASIAELRDIAMCLSVSVNCLLGKNIFEPQISQLDLFINTCEITECDAISGFWGHIGINTDGSKMRWFPITSSVRKMLYHVMDNDRIVVPCMNNRILYLNMQHIKEIVLLDDCCDPPQYIDWDYHVSEGEIPLVVYEALEDYIYDDTDEEFLSKKLKMYLKEFMEKKKLSEDDVYSLVSDSYIYYTDGKVRPINIDFSQRESITEEIEMAYLYEESEFVDNVLYCTDTGEAEVIFNMRNVAMMELPLLKVENKISDTRREEYE